MDLTGKIDIDVQCHVISSVVGICPICEATYHSSNRIKALRELALHIYNKHPDTRKEPASHAIAAFQ